MKKLLLFCAVFMAGTAMSFAQFANIGIIGGSTATLWNSDTDMVTTDGIIYTLNGVVITDPPTGTDGGIKFRQDDAWVNSWGGVTFPAGNATLNGSNIPWVPGTYNVTFNLTTGAFTFVNPAFDVIKLSGTTPVQLYSTDGVAYSVNNAVVAAGDSSFTVNNATTGWGGTGFPGGTATASATIPVLANNYNITFNTTTKAYMFNYVTISLIGAGVVDWNTDTDMTTTDGVNYTLKNFTFAGGEAKFRLNHDWGAMSWGSADFPSGTGNNAADAANVKITAGAYDVTFNRTTGAYEFKTPNTAGVNTVVASAITAFPNPTQSVWNFNAGNTTISNLVIVDVTGKIVMSKNVNAAQTTVDASGFAAGMYFAKVASAAGTQTIRVVKN